MINVIKKDNKILGICRIYVPNETLLIENNPKEYLINLVMNEIKSQVDVELFTYENIEIKEDLLPDLYGKDYTVTFEFVPNKAYVETLKLVSERLQIGL
jgi:hypothetical protein